MISNDNLVGAYNLPPSFREFRDAIYLSIHRSSSLPVYVDSLLGPRGSGLLMLKLLLKQTSPEDVTTVVLNIPGANLSCKDKVHRCHAYVQQAR